MADSRSDKCHSVTQAVQKQNEYLREHPRAKPEVALRKVQARAHTLGITSWVSLHQGERTIGLTQDSQALAEAAHLDGCYVLKTDLPAQFASKEVVHARYKDLAQVEWAFRSAKTAHLQMRPIYVRRESRTRGHALVVMLAYRLIQELAARWCQLDLTVQEGIDQLASLCLIEVCVNGKVPFSKIPQPSADVQTLLNKARVTLPCALQGKRPKVSTKKKLQDRRKHQ